MSKKQAKEEEDYIIDVGVIKPLPPFSEGLVGTIIRAEKVKTQRMGYDGVRVIVQDEKGNQYGEMLWIREQVGTRTKLGAFIVALGNDTRKWLMKKIRIVSWKPKDRAIEVL
jgi:hypothetical protein